MPQAVGGYVATALLGAEAAGTAAYAVVSALAATATTVAISAAASSIMAPAANKAAAPGGRASNQSVSNEGGVVGGGALSTSIAQPDGPRRLIYGTVKTGGLLVYTKKTPNDGELHRAIYLGEGPIQGIASVWVGDKESTDAPLAGHVTLETFTGAAGQTYSTSLAAVSEGEWTSAAVGVGLAWAHVTYTWDLDAFRTGAPLPAFTVLGRLVYDPRTATTLTIATSNPALILLDFIRSEFGYKHPDSWIDFASFAAAANICDELVVSIDSTNVVGGTSGRVRRYSCNGVFETDASPAKTVQAILDCCAGALVFVGGKYRLYVGAYRAPSGPPLTSEYLRAAPGFRTHPTRQQRYNIARGTYREPKQDWQMVDLLEQKLSAAVIAEAGEIVQTVTLPAVTNGAQAQRIARLQMNLARSAVPLVLQCNYAALAWQLFDVVDVDLTECGAVGEYLIVNMVYQPSGGIDCTLIPHLASDYAWDPGTMEGLVEEVPKPNWDYDPPTVNLLGILVATEYDGGSIYRRRGIAQWDAVDWVILAFYEVQIQEGSGDWVDYQTSGLRWEFIASVDLSYNVRVRAHGLNGKIGAWSSTETVDVEYDTDTAGSPSGISVSGDTLHIIAWTNPTDTNFRAMRVLTVAGPGLGSPAFVTEADGSPGARMQVTSGYPAGTHYALQSVTIDGALGTIVYAGEGVSDASLFVEPINTAITDLDGRVSVLESP